MCRDCKLAGQLNENGLALMEAGRETDAGKAFTRAEMLHDYCDEHYASSCTCQHTTRVAGLHSV